MKESFPERRHNNNFHPTKLKISTLDFSRRENSGVIGHSFLVSYGCQKKKWKENH